MKPVEASEMVEKDRLVAPRSRQSSQDPANVSAPEPTPTDRPMATSYYQLHRCSWTSSPALFFKYLIGRSESSDRLFISAFTLLNNHV